MITLTLTDGRTVNLTQNEAEFITGAVMKADFYENGIDSTPWTWSFCFNRSDNATLGSLIEKGVMFSQSHGQEGKYAGFTNEVKASIVEVLGEYGEKFGKNEGIPAAGPELVVDDTQSDRGEGHDPENKTMANKTMVGTAIKVQGYGKIAKKSEEVKVVGIDAKYVTLQFVNEKDPKDTANVKFKLADGMAVGAEPESGYKIDEATLKSLQSPEGAAPKPAKKAAESKDAPADEKAKNGKAPVAKKPAADKSEAKETATRTRRTSRTGISDMPTVSKTGLVIRMADKGFFGTQETLTKLAKKDENAKLVLDEVWKKTADIKTWLFLPFEKTTAEAFWNLIPTLRDEFRALGIKGAGFNRSLSGLEAQLKEKFRFKAHAVAAPAPAAKKPEVKPAAKSAAKPEPKPAAAAKPAAKPVAKKPVAAKK